MFIIHSNFQYTYDNNRVFDPNGVKGDQFHELVFYLNSIYIDNII